MSSITELETSKYALAAGRLLSGMIVLFMIHGGAAAVAFGCATLVLLAHRERLDAGFMLRIVVGLYAAVILWGLLYVRCNGLRLLLPLWPS